MRTALDIDLPDAPLELRRGSPRLHDLAYAYLKGLLLAGGLDPGDQISSESVGRVLAVSRAPVSDAIRRLTVEGLLEVVPQVGCRVVRPARGREWPTSTRYSAPPRASSPVSPASAARPPKPANSPGCAPGLRRGADLPDDPRRALRRAAAAQSPALREAARAGAIAAQRRHRRVVLGSQRLLPAGGLRVARAAGLCADRTRGVRRRRRRGRRPDRRARDAALSGSPRPRRRRRAGQRQGQEERR